MASSSTPKIQSSPTSFDPTVSPHYKVVYPSSEPGGLVHVEIYSSETGNWKACKTNFSLPSFAMFDERVVYWHGAIHWLSRVHVYHLSLDEENILQAENHVDLYGRK
ncbi:hypothetical protein E3N88_19784 [Mikania micrantha]|uniref:F-box associated domain-containing protein n=1 Tax=Mikania micrantha TaxID=192012 RepID=A0A5N6NRY3_9ASTR|nr:hypothetical protein E3N88_19784 [Mikania micrantha]